MAILNARLADRRDLMPHATPAYGNIKGPRFIALPQLFDAVVDAAEDSMDLLAERVVQLGGAAEGTIQGATTRTGLKAYPLTLVEEREHVEALASALAAYGASIRLALEQTDTRGDQDTADLCTAISRGVDTYLCISGSSRRTSGYPHARRHVHEHDHDDRRHTDLLQGLGHGAARRLQPWLAAQRRR